MKAYMSLSTKGYKILRKDDLDYKMFKLSLHLLRLYFREVHLVTDNEGARYLEDLPFTSIDTRLEKEVPEGYRMMWVLGKLLTYKLAAERGDSFIHVDNDVFLFQKIPDHILLNPVIAQHEERGAYHFYEAEFFINSLVNKYLFNEKKIDYAANTGVFGGLNLDFIHYYATEALKAATDPENKKVICNTFYRQNFSPPCMIEQYYLSLLAELKGVNVTYFLELNSLQDNAQKLKFVHVWDAKRRQKENILNKLDELLYKYNLISY